MVGNERDREAETKIVSVKMSESRVDEIDSEASARDVSRSKLIRRMIDDYDSIEASYSKLKDDYSDLQDSYEELRGNQADVEALKSEIEELTREVDRQKRERRLLLEQREEHTDLVEAVRDDRTLAQRRAEAGLLTKLRWAFTGMPSESESEA